jgi:glucose uptake protein
MILPSSHTVVFILLILGMLGWGLWANTWKSTGGKWRFELFYFDFALGLLIAAIVLALTAGSLGFDGFSFRDDLQLAGKRQDLFGFSAGVIFNLGNMLLLGAVSVAGMSVVFPIGMGLALIVAACWNFALYSGGNATFLFIGVAMVLAAIVLAILTSKASVLSNPPAPVVTTAAKKKPKKKSSVKSVGLSLAGGLLLGSFWRLLQMGGAGENGLGPYSIGVMFALGVFFSTFVFNLFFMNLPVEGEPIDIAEYFRAKLERHGRGVLGGAIWYAGLITALIIARLQGPAAISAHVTYGVQQLAIVLAALCGVFLWREFDGAKSDARVRLGLMFVLLLVGIGLSAAGMAPAPPLNP